MVTTPTTPPIVSPRMNFNIDLHPRFLHRSCIVWNLFQDAINELARKELTYFMTLFHYLHTLFAKNRFCHIYCAGIELSKNVVFSSELHLLGIVFGDIFFNIIVCGYVVTNQGIGLTLLNNLL